MKKKTDLQKQSFNKTGSVHIP